MFEVAKITYNVGQLCALQNLHLNEVFEFAITSSIYWLIECTPKHSFVGVFELARITYIYCAIECTSKPSFVGMLEF
jgi:hypothetical protein